MHPAKNKISISAAPMTGIIQKQYYHLPSTITVMNSLRKVVDGFEIQYLAEWNPNTPPQDDVSGSRRGAWIQSPKYTVDEIASLLVELPVLSIHANRDVGIYLCRENREDVQKGKALIEESLSLAQKIGAKVCVFHLWDTFRKNFDIESLCGILHEITPSYPGVAASVENIPTHMKTTPFELVKYSDWITLDIRWAAMYDELPSFELIKDRIINVHLRGTLAHNAWVLDNASFTFNDALKTIKNWEYSGLLTMEPEGGIGGSSLQQIAMAMSSLK